MSEGFPLEIVWSLMPRELEWVTHAPVLVGDRLLLRIRRDVLAIDPEDGSIADRVEVDPADSAGLFALLAGERLITDGRGARRLATAAAVSPDGELCWTVELGVRAAKQTGAVDGDRVLVCGQDGDGDNRLLSIDVASGEVDRSAALPYGAAGCVPAGDRVIIAHPTAEDGDPGLYSVARDGTDARSLEPRPVQRLGAAGSVVIACARAGDDAWELVALNRSGGDRLWQRGTGSAACAIDGDDVACLIAGVDEARPGLIDAATGEPRWIAEAPTSAPPSKARLTGDLALFSFGHGVAIYRRGSGELVGEALGYGDAGLVVGDRLYLGGSEQLICAAIS